MTTTGIDENHYKHKYADTWDESAAREQNIQREIEERTNLKLTPKGLGATSTEFIEGSAAKNGAKKGDADFEIADKCINIEVTGPLVKSVKPSAPLWIRPDKLRNALDRLPGEISFIVHHLPFNNLKRVVEVNSDIGNRMDSGDLKIIKPKIRGGKETYVQIYATDDCVMYWDTFIERLIELTE